MSNPIQRFTGIFIPSETMELEELTLFEERLLSIIDSLYCKQHGGCFASNEYLAKKMKNAKENTVAKAITKLRSMGLIEDISFNGRQRVIRACIGKFMEKSQSKAGLDLNPRQGWIKIQGSIGFLSNATDPSPYILDSKEYIKEERERTSSSTPAPTSSKKKKKPKIEKNVDVVLGEVHSVGGESLTSGEGESTQWGGGVYPVDRGDVYSVDTQNTLYTKDNIREREEAESPPLTLFCSDRVICANLPIEDMDSQECQFERSQFRADRNYSSGQTGTTVPGRQEPQFLGIPTREDAMPPPATLTHSVRNQKAKIEKKAYRENILLSEAEHEKLTKQYGPEKLNWMLDYLEAKKGSNGNVYKSDYHVLLPANWVNTEYKKQCQEGKIDTIKAANSDHVCKNKKLAEFVEEKLRQTFTGYVYIQAHADHVLLYHKDKDIQKNISYAAYEPAQFKEIFIKESERCFPYVRNLFTTNNQVVNNLIDGVSQKFKMTED
jgi:Helix-turn-helix domain